MNRAVDREYYWRTAAPDSDQRIRSAGARIVRGVGERYAPLPLSRPQKAVGMLPVDRRVEYSTDACTALAAIVLLIVGLAGCAFGPAPMADRAERRAAPYVGVFTGEFVNGTPLYRFPTIEVIGSRRSVESVGGTDWRAGRYD